ncbi:MAG: toll/interleukin-1 receptor domain-containing protein [Hyphomonadaceae bacterium]|nr:toll/interleukin-1 receptor domain-containing protein [Hyphomonadaceae bacterium]
MPTFLAEDIRACEALGAFTPLFAAGELLPAEKLFRATFSRSPGANNSVSFFAGERPLAASLYHPGTQAGFEGNTSIEMKITLNAMGHFSTEARCVATMREFVTFCATLDVPLLEGDMQGNVEETLDSARLTTPEIQHSQDSTTAAAVSRYLPVHVGLADGGRFHLLLSEGCPLPTSASFAMESDDEGDLVFTLLSIEPNDLDDYEALELDRDGSIGLIDDDDHSLLWFFVDDLIPSEPIRITVSSDEFCRLRVQAHDSQNNEKEIDFDGASEALDLRPLVPTPWERVSKSSITKVEAYSSLEPAIAVAGMFLGADIPHATPLVTASPDDASEWSIETQQTLEPQAAISVAYMFGGVGEMSDSPLAPASAEANEPSNDETSRLVPPTSEDAMKPSILETEETFEPAPVASGLARSAAEISDQVFISYRSDADLDFALQLVGDLELNGIHCWVAPRDIEAGSDWNGAIDVALHDCVAMVVIVSKTTSESEFVQAEVQRALELGKRVVPILLEANVRYTSIDMRLQTRQRINWYRDEGRALEYLLVQLERIRERSSKPGN